MANDGLAESMEMAQIVEQPSAAGWPAMRYGQIPGIAEPVSRLVLGTMWYSTSRPEFSGPQMERFFALGGNAIDTAHVYGRGDAERAVGQWMRAQDARERAVLIVKGVCNDHPTPEGVTRELFASLDRLGTDHADLYLMHRDNPDVPASEFVDCLHEHRRAGRMRAFGGSNWTAARLQEANDYAAAQGIAGFAASSPHFSLARWNQPLWDDCVAASDPASRAWYAQAKMPLLAWSSLAHGFLAGRFSPEDADRPEAEEAARTWFNPDNWERLRRAGALGEKHGVSALQVALAYVLCQPAMDTYALIGPQGPDEIDTSMRALDIRLSLDELNWLDLNSSF